MSGPARPPVMPPGVRADAGRAAAPRDAGALPALVADAGPLLDVVRRLDRAGARDAPASSAAAWRATLLDALRDFERRALAHGAAAGRVRLGSYVLCTVVDEAVARTRWGAACDWTRQGLLVTRHREAIGGERVFGLAARCLRDPSREAGLLALLATVLALGFEGRYAVRADGAARLGQWRRRLAEALARIDRPHRPAAAGTCAARGAHRRTPGPAADAAGPDAARPGGAARSRIALAAGVLVLLASLVLADGWAARRVARAREAIVAALAAWRVSPSQAAPPVAAAPATPAMPGLRALLRPDIEAGRIEVVESRGRVRIVLAGDGFYPSGGAEVAAADRDMFRHLGHLLDRVPGELVVSGHTDDRPVGPGGPFASNAALSLARARGVADLLAGVLGDPARLQVEGRADRRPRASDATAAGRARNRRVEIEWRPPAGADDALAR